MFAQSLYSYFFSVMFLLFTFLPLCGAVLQIKGEGENLQNRVLSQFPDLNIASVMSGSFAEKFNAYIWDHLPLRSQFLSTDHWLDYYLFRDSPVPDQVLLGRDGWLFLYPAVMEWPRDDAEQADYFIRLARRADELQGKRNKKIYIVPSPAKASIYPEFLFDDNREEFLRYSQMYRNKLLAASLSGAKSFILLWESFAEEKKRLLSTSSGGGAQKGYHYLYRPRDRHFSWETSLFQAKKISEVIAPAQWSDTQADGYFTGYTTEQSELGRKFIKINLPEEYVSFKEKQFLADRSMSRETALVPKTKYKKVIFRAQGSYPLPQKLVVIHDSFFDQSMFFLAPSFREAVFMHWGVMRNKPAFLDELRSADIIVIQSVEGHWSWRYPQLEFILDMIAEG